MPAMLETWVRSLGWKDHLEKEMATHSSTLAWKIPWTDEPARLQSMESQRVGHDSDFSFMVISYISYTHTHTHTCTHTHTHICSYLQRERLINWLRLIYYDTLVHTFIEAKKFYSLLSAS